MGRFRKKPVEIQAWRINDLLIAGQVKWDDLPPEVADWYEAGGLIFGRDRLSVRTLEGVMDGGREDWLILGVEGEFYPCKGSVFAATYEAVA